MKLPVRSHIAIILAVIYGLIIMSPLVSNVLNSTTTANALTGECTGDCATCGCSTKSMATGTCCCMKKKQQHHAHKDDNGNPDCNQEIPDSKQTFIASCGCPSGNGKYVTLSGSDTSELLPCYFTVQFSIPSSATSIPLLNGCVTPFQDEPPDPPPETSTLS